MISLYMMSRGWRVRLSKGSRGPADLYAEKESNSWYVQVKASSKAPHIKGSEIKRLIDYASDADAHPILALLQPSLNSIPYEKLVYPRLLSQEQEELKKATDAIHPFESFYFSFYHLPTWCQLKP